MGPVERLVSHHCTIYNAEPLSPLNLNYTWQATTTFGGLRECASLLSGLSASGHRSFKVPTEAVFTAPQRGVVLHRAEARFAGHDREPDGSISDAETGAEFTAPQRGVWITDSALCRDGAKRHCRTDHFRFRA